MMASDDLADEWVPITWVSGTAFEAAIGQRDRLLDIIDRAAGSLAGVQLEQGWHVSNAHIKVLKAVREARAILAEADPENPEAPDGRAGP